ncbi:hypothetical protein ABW21_db0208200 [Orbilia brochopaga]|nr:hypothetical protein ABW21_db0208200 [Drechslerella brochopaga]
MMSDIAKVDIFTGEPGSLRAEEFIEQVTAAGLLYDVLVGNTRPMFRQPGFPNCNPDVTPRTWKRIFSQHLSLKVRLDFWNELPVTDNPTLISQKFLLRYPYVQPLGQQLLDKRIEAIDQMGQNGGHRSMAEYLQYCDHIEKDIAHGSAYRPRFFDAVLEGLLLSDWERPALLHHWNQMQPVDKTWVGLKRIILWNHIKNRSNMTVDLQKYLGGKELELAEPKL